MSRDRSLDEFTRGSEAGGEKDGPENGALEGETEEPDRENEAESGEERPDVEPIETTYGWSPGGGTCESCGATVQTRWRDGGKRVCADCKEW